MGRWSRDEIESAFERYQELGRWAGSSGNWAQWADQFTEDATYVEHHYGTFGGRDAILRWISSTMAQEPNRHFRQFPVEWYVIDEERGWVVCHVWNRLADPGDGSIHQAANFTLLKYAGNGQWSYEEDVYNPARFAEVLETWSEAHTRLGGAPPGREPVIELGPVFRNEPDLRLT